MFKKTLCKLKYFLIPFLELEDYYDCEKCKRKSKAHKKFVLTKSPNFLMIVMKKFTLAGKKIEDRIKYPFELDLKDVAEGHCG